MYNHYELLQVVGSQARILYSDQKGRTAIALAFNKAVADGQLKVGRSWRLLSHRSLILCNIHILLWSGTSGHQQGPS